MKPRDYTAHHTTMRTPPDGSCPCKGFCTTYCCRDMACSCYRGAKIEGVQFAMAMEKRGL